MTNEELVRLIQDGQSEYIPRLWDQVYLFIRSMAKKRLLGEFDHIKQMEDDLINESYFDFLRAVEGYNAECEGSFINSLTYHLKNAFNRALGIRTQKDKRNLMHRAVSLDTPIADADDMTLQDMIIDHMAEEDYHFIESADFWRNVHELLEDAIMHITSGAVQDAFLVMLHEGCKFSEACRRLDIPEEKMQSMNSMHTTSLHRIRRHMRGKVWRRCREIGIDEYFNIGLRGSGLTAYRNHCFTSSTEMAAIRLADKELWYRKMVEMLG